MPKTTTYYPTTTTNNNNPNNPDVQYLSDGSSTVKHGHGSAYGDDRQFRLMSAESNNGGHQVNNSERHFRSVDHHHRQGNIAELGSDGGLDEGEEREELKQDELMDLFSPINLMRVEKGRGGLRISGTHAGNSESGHSVSGGSFSGSG